MPALRVTQRLVILIEAVMNMGEKHHYGLRIDDVLGLAAHLSSTVLQPDSASVFIDRRLPAGLGNLPVFVRISPNIGFHLHIGSQQSRMHTNGHPLAQFPVRLPGPPFHYRSQLIAECLKCKDCDRRWLARFFTSRLSRTIGAALDVGTGFGLSLETSPLVLVCALPSSPVILESSFRFA